MTTKEMIEVMQAFADGIEIEAKTPEHPDWGKIYQPVWNWEKYSYRIKPKQTYRPYDCIDEFIQAQKEHGPYIRNLTLPEHYYVPTEVYSDINDNNEFTVVFSDRIGITNKILANKEEWQWQDGSPCCKLL